MKKKAIKEGETCPLCLDEVEAQEVDDAYFECTHAKCLHYKCFFEMIEHAIEKECINLLVAVFEHLKLIEQINESALYELNVEKILEQICGMNLTEASTKLLSKELVKCPLCRKPLNMEPNIDEETMIELQRKIWKSIKLLHLKLISTPRGLLHFLPIIPKSIPSEEVKALISLLLVVCKMLKGEQKAITDLYIKPHLRSIKTELAEIYEGPKQLASCIRSHVASFADSVATRMNLFNIPRFVFR